MQGRGGNPFCPTAKGWMQRNAPHEAQSLMERLKKACELGIMVTDPPLAPPHTRRGWDTERWNDLPKVTQIVRD